MCVYRIWTYLYMKSKCLYDVSERHLHMFSWIHFPLIYSSVHIDSIDNDKHSTQSHTSPQMAKQAEIRGVLLY